MNVLFYIISPYLHFNYILLNNFCVLMRLTTIDNKTDFRKYNKTKYIVKPKNYSYKSTQNTYVRFN